MPKSMTGFARLEEQYPWGTLSCEIRSVNHRYLENGFRLPDELRALEAWLRENLKKRVTRGKVDVSIYLRTDKSEGEELEFDPTLAAQIISAAEQVSQQLKKPGDISPVDILRWPGVMQSAEIEKDTLMDASKSLFNEALSQLVENRQREGAELAVFIEQRLAAIQDIVDTTRKLLPEILQAQDEKIRAKIEALQIEVDEERFAQELVFISQKADIAEELDRLEAHLAEVRLSLKNKGPIGRRLDFLMQELNREANTLSSKSIASSTTLQAVDLKVLIEQMREQIQNIE